jgi:hypothetical protein
MPENETPQPFDAASLTDDELAAEHARIQTRGGELSAKAEFADGEADELAELAARADAVQAEMTSREEKAAATAAAREKFAAKPAPAAEEPPAAVEPTKVETAAEVAVPSVSEMSKQAPQMPVTRETGKEFSVFVSGDASGLVGKRAGEEYDGLTEVSEALLKAAQQYGRVGGGAGSRHAIAQFQRTRASEFVVERPEDGMKVLQHARNEARLKGGSLAKQWQADIDAGKASLTAAAGWCAPSENRYDVCSLWGSNVGLLDLPTIAVRRGGLNYTDEPSFAQIYASMAATLDTNFLTEAEVEAGTTSKECIPVPCPDFEDRRLDVLALCIQVSFMQAVGYPEIVNAWVDGLMEAEAQEINRLIIADMVTRGGAATTYAPLAGGSDSFTSALLAAAELAAVDIRYREGMPLNATVEVVYPYWVLAQIRADLSRRTRETASMLSVSDSQIASLFSARNIRAQFVRGYQDGLITGGALDPTFPGGDATAPYLTALPTDVDFMAYPAGSVAVARQDVVTLTNVYDAASNSANTFTKLFAEEGFAPVYPCPGLRNYTVSGCPAGVVGAAELTCTAPVAG